MILSRRTAVPLYQSSPAKVVLNSEGGRYLNTALFILRTQQVYKLYRCTKRNYSSTFLGYVLL